MKRPYLTPEIDERYQLQTTRDGCWGLWGKLIYKGSHHGYNVYFKPYGFYPTGQAEGGEALEMSIRLPSHCVALMNEIARGYVYTWLDQLRPPRSDLLKRKHHFTELWKIKHNQLSAIVVWEREAPDLTVIPDVVDRLIAVSEIIKEVADHS